MTRPNRPQLPWNTVVGDGVRQKRLKRLLETNPCIAGPAAPDQLEIVWENLRHRHHRFRADCLWNEVFSDADGYALTLPIDHYVMHFQRSTKTLEDAVADAIDTEDDVALQAYLTENQEQKMRRFVVGARDIGAEGELTAKATDADTTISIRSEETPPATPFRLQIHHETLRVTGVTTGTGRHVHDLTVTRGIDGTTAVAHQEGSVVAWGRVLVDDIGSSDIALNVISALPIPETPFVILIDNEEMEVTGVSGTGPYEFDVNRGWYGSSATDHSGGSVVSDGVVEKLVHSIIHSDQFARFQVRSVSKNGKTTIKSQWSDWTPWSSPNDPPPSPTDVDIQRAPHGILLDWEAPDDIVDPLVIDKRIGYFVSELYSTDDQDVFPFDNDHLYKRARHIHRTKHKFRVDQSEDEELWYYGRVRSVSTDDVKGVWIPATQAGNDDPDADPSLKKPKWQRRVLTFNIPGPLQSGLYAPPNRMDDDYLIRRVTGACDVVGLSAASKVDIIVNGSSMFDDDEGLMLSFGAGNDDASTKDMVITTLSRGDHLKVKGYPHGVPPEDITIQIIADRVN